MAAPTSAVQILQNILANGAPFSDRPFVVKPAFPTDIARPGVTVLFAVGITPPHNLVRKRKCFNVHTELPNADALTAQRLLAKSFAPSPGGKFTSRRKTGGLLER